MKRLIVYADSRQRLSCAPAEAGAYFMWEWELLEDGAEVRPSAIGQHLLYVPGHVYGYTPGLALANGIARPVPVP